MLLRWLLTPSFSSCTGRDRQGDVHCDPRYSAGGGRECWTGAGPGFGKCVWGDQVERNPTPCMCCCYDFGCGFVVVVVVVIHCLCVIALWFMIHLLIPFSSRYLIVETG